MTALALNQIVRKSVSCYTWWPLDDENIWECAQEDLRECWVKDNKFIIHNPDGSIYKELTDDRALDIDIDYWGARGKEGRLRKRIAEIFQDNIECECQDLTNSISFGARFKKYGLLYHGMSYRSPQYYNYENDELEIHLTEDQFEDDDLPPRQETNPELIPLVQKYIDEVMIRSYDGYCSFEPTSVDRVDRLDYAYLWAVLQKEWIYEWVQKAIEESWQDIQDEMWEYTLVRYLYKYEDEEWKHCDKIYYDGIWLVVESQRY